ncbi:helix-turn-helix domain-containing protein [uncultured Ruminococcus sp.]|uniref:helix-turn-helix domain-containing protein n=1 Tax=uncultured Ruminococcus sp. TaxID=165186 RepID=UPI0025F9D797|nr:helix-turn-helix transcriptional regulator [uncultured Ruminococcus sp.]
MFVIVNIDKLIELRKKQNLSQHKLSLKAGLSGNAVQRLESGANITNQTSNLRLKAIAAALEVDEQELILCNKEGVNPCG